MLSLYSLRINFCDIFLRTQAHILYFSLFFSLAPSCAGAVKHCLRLNSHVVDVWVPLKFRLNEGKEPALYTFTPLKQVLVGIVSALSGRLNGCFFRGPVCCMNFSLQSIPADRVVYCEVKRISSVGGSSICVRILLKCLLTQQNGAC